jgi:diguanylate cyclase (GGDEF)-like protein
MIQDRPGFRRAAPSSVDAERTGVPFSQAQILHLMKTEFARARRYGYPLSCVLLEIDRLQALAETHGAEVRQTLKRNLARIIDEKTRGHDYLGAISDGHHLLVLPHTDAAQALVVADRVRRNFAELEVRVDGHPLHVTLSLGLATCEDRETMFFDTLVSQAEVALTWAMREGGNRAVAFRRDRFVGPPDGPR